MLASTAPTMTWRPQGNRPAGCARDGQGDGREARLGLPSLGAENMPPAISGAKKHIRKTGVFVSYAGNVLLPAANDSFEIGLSPQYPRH
jgi:hypothetical protein